MLSSQQYSFHYAAKRPLQEQCRFHGRLHTQRTGYVVKFQKLVGQSSHVSNQRHAVLTYCSISRNSNLNGIAKKSQKNRLLCFTSLPATFEQEGVSNCNSNDHEPKTYFSRKLNAFWRFCRPHTIIGTVIGITSVSLLPVETFGDLSITLLLEVLKVMVPAVLMNIYVVGLNQLYDVEIDKINKPDLPLASGEFSMGTGVAIVIVASCLSFALGFMLQSPPILSALLICFLIGSTYSLDLPFLRWKRYPFLAALSILAVRALVLQTTFFVHVQKYVLGRLIFFTKSFLFGTSSVCLFSGVIALFKDIPDVDGDGDFGIQSFSVRLGQEKIFWFCISVLSTVYAVAVVVGATSQFNSSMLVTVLGHCILATALWLRARDTDLANKESLTSFYMFIWKLFYIEYFLIPFVR